MEVSTRTSALLRARPAVGAALAASLALGTALAAAPAAGADAVRDEQYWLQSSGIEKAWAETKGGGVTVAVIDTGIDASHPDLYGRVVGGTDVSGAGEKGGTGPIGALPEHGTRWPPCWPDTATTGRTSPGPRRRTTSSAPPGNVPPPRTRPAGTVPGRRRAAPRVGVAPEAPTC